MDKKSLLTDPASEFETPKHLVESQALSDKDKLTALQNWRLDLIELQEASNENMPSTGSDAGAGAAAEQLREVVKAIAALEDRNPGKGD